MNFKILDSLCSDGLTQREISDKLGVSHTSVRYWLKKYGLKTKGKIGKFDYSNDKNIREIVASSYSFSECLRKMGLSCVGSGSRKSLKRYIELYDISTSHFNPYSRGFYKDGSNTNSIKLDEILKGMHPQYSTGKVKKRIIRAGLIKNECSKCGLGNEWQGEPITLQLDHINGINNDHRLENLRILCPNCHTQTKTYGSKGGIKSGGDIPRVSRRKDNVPNPRVKRKIKDELINCKQCFKEFVLKNNKKYCSVECSAKASRKVDRPEKTELELFLSNNTMVAAGKNYGVSDNAVRKWAKAYGILI